VAIPGRDATSQDALDVIYPGPSFRSFIYERVRRHADSSTQLSVSQTQLGGSELCDPNHKKLALYLDHDVFMRVAHEIFSDGQFNWGRVVALFYFASRLVIKALLNKVPDIIRTIISWATDYLRDHVINWIRDQGGWEGIRSYFGTPTRQTVGVFLAGALTTVLVMRRM
uniref:BCL2 associated X, apoptosis regulator a n=1 Tax=Oncorhynchus kisutch TaxID=8019 RepID=A0A8C7H3A1_ONCKI